MENKKTDAKDLVRLMKYIANGGDSSDGSSSDSVTTAPVDTDAPEPDNFTIENYFDGGDENEIVAFADGQIYAFSGLRGFFELYPSREGRQCFAGRLRIACRHFRICL